MTERRGELGLWGLTAVLGALLATIRIRSVDFFWHLAAGEWILDHGRIPRTDPFRFTSESAFWIDHEWLFQLLLGVGERLGGIPLLGVVRGCYGAVLALLLFFLARRKGASPLAGLLLAGVAVVGIRARFMYRPELMTFLALAVLLHLLESLRQRPSWISVAGIALLTVVWVNAHPGALMAPGVVGLFLLGAAWQARREGDSTGARRLGLTAVTLGAATGLALLVNPWGVRILTVPFEISGALEGVAGFNPDWLPAWKTPRPLFFVGLLAVLLLVVVARRRGERLDLAWLLLTAAVGLLGILQTRQQPLFWIAAVGFAATSTDWEWWGTRTRRRAAVLASLVLGGMIVWCLGSRPDWPGRQSLLRFGLGIQPGLFPREAVDRLESDWTGVGPLYHDMAFGGYLAWRTFPERQIFWDSRNEVDPGLLREVGRARRSGRRWFRMLDRYDVDGALVGYDEARRPEVVLEAGEPKVVGRHTTHALFFPPERFALVYWDDTAMLFVRRSPERAGRLEREEYRFVHPEDWIATLERASGDAELRRGIERELRRRLRERPSSRRAHRMWRELRALEDFPAESPG